MRVLFGKEKKSPRWKDCVALVNNKMSFAGGAMYVRKYFDRSSKDVAMEMVSEIRKTFREMLRTNKWMDENTKKYAVEKVKSFFVD